MDYRRIYILSDLHFGVRNNAIAWKTMMDDYFDWFVKDIKSKGFDNEKDALFILGDVFNSRDSLNVMILMNTIETFKKLKSEINNIHVIVGNHDAYYIDSNDITSLELLEMTTGIKGYYSPEQITVSGKKVMMLPWNNNFEEIHNVLSSDDSEYLFCHMDINGMKYNGSTIKNKADREILKKYNKVFSGHIHIRQDSGNILYVGSPYHLDLGDIDNEKGYYYIDCEDDFKYTFVKNDFSPYYKNVTIGDILNNDLDTVKKMIDNTYLNVMCGSSAYSKINLISLRQQLKDLGIEFKKMEFIENKDVTETTTLAQDMSTFTFDINKSGRKLLEEKKRDESHIEDVLSYLNELYSSVKKSGYEDGI